MSLGYEEFLLDNGLEENFIRTLSENENDVIDIYCNGYLKDSEIEGTGFFADKDLKEGNIIGYSRLNGMRTYLGRYVNHSNEPNIRFQLTDDDLIVIALKDIKENEEFTVNYNQARLENKISIFNFQSLIHDIKLDLYQYNNRQKIEILEWIIENKMDNIADDLPITHNIYGGMYEREMFIPEGVILTGKIHLKDHIFILLEGDLSVMTDIGIKRIQAPYKFNVKAGIKKIGYAHTDVKCTTIHKTNKKSIEKIERELVKDSDLSWVANLLSKNEEVALCHLQA